MKISIPSVRQLASEIGGIYAGIAAADGELPERHLFLLPDKPPKALDWKKATDWAAALGNGARLPTRFEAALIYANLREQIEDKSDWYWTCTPRSDGYVWVQFFDDGYRTTGHKGYESLACAVRWIPVNPSTL